MENKGTMPKKNAYVMFAESRRAELVAQGRTTTGSLIDLVPLCSDEWTALSTEEREKYREMAKKYNEKRKAAATNASAQGDAAENATRINDISRQNNRAIVEEIFKRKNDQDFDWRAQTIVICSFTLFLDAESCNHQYIPAEIGLTAVNLIDGVVDNFARIIDPIKLPRGYEKEAAQNAERLGLPKFGSVPSFADVDHLTMMLENFLTMYNKGKLDRGSVLYLFAFDSDYEMVIGCLDWIFDKFEFKLPVKVLSLDQFIYLASLNSHKSLKDNRCSTGDDNASGNELSYSKSVSSYRQHGNPLTSKFVYGDSPLCSYGVFLNEAEVDSFIKGIDNYKYYEELCCVYHVLTENQVQNCVLNESNRYAFGMLEYLTLTNDVEVVAGQHYPEIDNPPLEKGRRFHMLRRWGLSQEEEDMYQDICVEKRQQSGK